MIKLFRNTRKKLLRQGKTANYVKYAVGEIVLVVIGILIALSINNWNERRKSDTSLQVITQNLKQEFESNSVKLDDVLQNLTFTKGKCLELLKLMQNPDTTLPEKELNKMIEATFFWPTWDPSSYVLTDLKNSGKLSLIKNQHLKELLFEWERQIDISNDWKRYMQESSQDLIDYVKSNGSLRDMNHERLGIEGSSLKTDNTALLRDVRFENFVDAKALYAQFLENTYREDQELIIRIINTSNDD